MESLQYQFTNTHNGPVFKPLAPFLFIFPPRSY